MSTFEEVINNLPSNDIEAMQKVADAIEQTKAADDQYHLGIIILTRKQLVVALRSGDENGKLYLDIQRTEYTA